MPEFLATSKARVDLSESGLEERKSEVQSAEATAVHG